MICRSEFDESIGRARAADIGDVDYLDVEDRFDRLPSLRWSEFERFLKGGVPARALVYPELLARSGGVVP